MSRQVAIVAIILSAVCRCEAYDMVPRAALYIPSPPSILLSGGKTLSPDGTYASSPNSPDLLRLPLSSNFDTASPPYELLNATGPAYAWHTLSSINTSQAFSFGGDGGPSTPLPAGTDSSWFISLRGDEPPSFAQQSSDWAAQPQRRILHSATTGPDGMVYITGGQRNDGSGLILSDAYAFNPNTSTFTPLPSLPRGTAHHISTLLSNGTLVVIGGIYTSSISGNPTLSETSKMYTLDTKSATPAWWEATAGGAAPPARRGASGVLMADEKMYVLGGTGMSSAEAMGDMWVMDMRSGVWSQVSSTGDGPSARFDHAAVNIGNGQMYVFGGYGAGSPASNGTYIFESAINAWTTSFAVPTVTAAATHTPTPTPTASSDPSANPAPSAGPSDPAAISTPQSTPTADPSSSASPTQSATPQSSTVNLSKSAQIGLALGVAMGLGVLAALIILCIRRRRAGYGQPTADDAGSGPLGWLSPRPPPLEKDGQALLGDPRSGARPGEWSEKGGIIGLGLGAVGAGFAAMRSGKEGDYHQLEDEGAPTRQPTRRVGGGIKLIGPRSNPSALAREGARSPPRVDMFHDEDSRTFLRLPKTEDWKVDRSGKDGWRSANTVLGHASDEPDVSDPFEDVPLIRGGPVPTPIAARSEIDPFEDQPEQDITTAVSRGPGLYQLPPLASSDPFDIAGLLAPGRGQGDTSLPRSQHSRISTAYTSSDAEEGTVHHAQFASQASALYSPVESEYVPIKRNESFFRRMAAGGISSLIGGGRRESVRRSLSRDIRDPAPGPGPALWPVESRDEAEPSRPPTSWGVGGHAKGPSLSSLASARSMRDMVIVQREGTDSSEASLVIVEQEKSDAGTPVLDGMSPMQTEEDMGSSGRRLDRSFYAEPSFFASPTEEDFGLVRPSGLSTSTAAPTTTIIPSSTSTAAIRAGPAIIATSSASPQPTPSSSIPAPRPSAIPSGSPLPRHLVEHRRPVKDMVFSINKRASTVALGVDPVSPSSQYSATPGPTPLLGKGRAESWEVRRRESLVVANPDKRLRGGA